VPVPLLGTVPKVGASPLKLIWVASIQEFGLFQLNVPVFHVSVVVAVIVSPAGGIPETGKKT
jgi:hypothetical protein